MRIAVTRLQEKSAGTEEIFRKFGHEAVIVSTMRAVMPGDGSLDRLVSAAESGGIDFLVFTSSLGVKYFFSKCRKLPSKTVIISVGPKTRESVVSKGYKSEVLGAYTSEAFASYLGERVRDRVVGIARAGEPNPQLIASLRSLGARVIEAVAYELVPEKNEIRKVLDDVDAVLFTSAKSFTSTGLTREEMRDVLTMAIGARTAKAMKDKGITPDITGDGTLESCLSKL